MKKFAFIIAAVALTLFMSCHGKDVKITPKDKGNVVNNNSLPAVAPDTVVKVVYVPDTTKKVTVVDNSKGTESVMEDADNGKVKKVSDADLKKKGKKKFYVIAGSYKDIRWAKNVTKFYKDKGYPISIMRKSNGWTRVSLGNYEYRVSAEKQLKKFRSKGIKFKGKKLEYWLLLK